ncbi:GntR family transcriptional regulator [Niabella ginsengisoli]|uniref:GntR family transcriptional regulator n=1 Tax=Niabella ginsengisoli TaxID=522298 RepID=A0ABS9SKM8_9BACT|nr:GntR family transcriptional regulator [Niabella ginsengisoli]MCH5598933.1 GntR family transcriptional regulator [Niabella ginsengisoli]
MKGCIDEKNESKYKQIINFIIEQIDSGKLKKGDWIPSINDFRKKYNLSRDTVFAAITDLKTRGIIESTPGVGYISSVRKPSKKNIFLLFNEFTDFKQDLYNSFIGALDKTDSADLYFHNYNRKVFEALINDAHGKYTTYVIMPGKFQGIEPILQALQGRVFLLDHYHNELTGKYSSVAQNFEKDTYEALCSAANQVTKYKRIFMVQNEEKEPYERYNGLQKFCVDYKLEHKYINSVHRRKIREGDLFILVSDRDLVDLLKQADKQKFAAGKEFGIISYNNTPLKEILSGGITTLSTDFIKMGKTMASILNNKKVETIENAWTLDIRRSL